MQNEITVTPLVDILSEMLGEPIVMRDGRYVYLSSKNYVEQSYIDEATLKQEERYKTEKQEAISQAIQEHLDTKARELRYDNMMSARSYAGYTNPFQTEAQALALWCADCWAKAGAIEADVEAGNRPMPSVEDVLSELPVYGA